MSEPIKSLAQLCVERGLKLRHAVDLFETLYVADVVSESGGNIPLAAKRMGIERTVAYRKMHSHKIPVEIEEDYDD